MINDDPRKQEWDLHPLIVPKVCDTCPNCGGCRNDKCGNEHDPLDGFCFCMEAEG